MKYILTAVLISAAMASLAQYNATTSDLNKNWLVTKVLSYDGNVKGINKSYFDINGNLSQTQTRDMTSGQVLTSQVINDAYGRFVLRTLSAPINSGNFSYQPNFILNGSGTPYSFLNFDLNKTNNPDPVGGQGTAGTLGWYYSNNNTLEARVATTSYPYVRNDFYTDGSGKDKRSSKAGDAYKMGSSRESSMFNMPVINDLNNYLQVRNKYFTTGEVGALPVSLSNLAMQTVAKDITGKEVISIKDLDGRELMIARPGTDLSVSNTVPVSAMNYELSIAQASGFFNFTDLKINDNGADGIVIRNGVQVHNGPLNLYVPVSTYNTLVIKANKPFTINYTENVISIVLTRYTNVTCTHKGTETEVCYFRLINNAGSNVTITPDPTYGGTYDLYDMNTEQLVSFGGSGTLAKGYYKLVGKRGKVNLSYSNSYSDITYYYYNQLGKRVAIIHPEGVKRLIQNINAYPARTDVPFITTMEYSVKGQMIACTLPDVGRSEFIYRKDGKLRFSQNAEQAVSGWFSYTNYDRSGRPVENGEYHPSGDVTFAGLKTNTAILEDVSSTGGLAIAGNKYDFVKTLYDVEDVSHGMSSQGFYAGFLIDAVSMTETADTKTWYGYDAEGRTTWVIKWINGVGYKTTNYTYDVEGRTSKTVYQKDVPAEIFVHYYEYDADGRLEKVYTNTTDDVNTKTLQAKYIYYVHGPLKRMELGGNLQGIDYTYTLDGKLKAINHSDKTKDPGNDAPGTNGFLPDAFGELIEYYSNDYVRTGTNISSITINPVDAPEQYGGQMRGMSWFSSKPTASGASDNTTMYVYKYDDKYQYNEATWGSVSGSNFVPQAGVNKETVTGYDMHGNIQSVVRTGANGTITDNFLYTYIQSPKFTNKISSVTQQTNGQNYATYQYDNIGRLKAEIPGPAYGSAISKYIKYDVGGKITGVYSDAGMTVPLVKFVYDEIGQRVKKMSYSAGVLQTTTYYIYSVPGRLQSVYEQNSGGGIVQKEIPIDGKDRIAVYFRASNAYRYELTDHQENVRAVFVKVPAGNNDMVVYRDYYAFGKDIPGRSHTDGDGYRYDYQGEYAQKDGETNWHSFKLRMYDSRLGRWLSIDPEGQYASPYVGMGNDPANGVDPDGGFFIIDDFIFGFIAGLFKPVEEGSTRFGSMLDNGFRMASNSLSIWASFGRVDENRTTVGKILQVVSRFTWELPQQLTGVLAGHALAYFNGVEAIHNFMGATWIETRNDPGNSEWGFTVGSVINTSYGASGELVKHEFGHYLQSRMVGPGYLIITAPSLISVIFGEEFHSKMPWEQVADYNSKIFFERRGYRVIQ